MQVRTVAIGAFLLASSAAALAQGREPQQFPPPFPMMQGSPEEQQACAPNVDRFCKDAVPDTFRVLACLKDHRERLSRACRQVLESHGQ
jgi:hypothetical protein